MEVIINGELRQEIKSVNQLNELLVDLRIQCARENLVIQMLVNGEAKDSILPGLTEAELDTVEIQLQSSEEVVIESIVEGVSYLPRFIGGLAECLHFFRGSNQNQAILYFGQCLDGFHWLNHVLAGIKLYILPMQEFEKVSTTYQTQIEGFEGVIKELMDVWQNEDFVLMADLIEYEMIPQLEQIKDQFRQILDRLVEVE